MIIFLLTNKKFSAKTTFFINTKQNCFLRKMVEYNFIIGTKSLVAEHNVFNRTKLLV